MAQIGYLQVTRKCNQECIICSNPPIEEALSIKEAKKKIDELVADGNTGIIITGGEPTMYQHLVDVIAYAKKSGLFPRMITNGQKMADLDFVKKLKIAGLQHVHVSIYSYKPEIQSRISKNKNSLENILKTLDNIRNVGEITVNINIAISRINANHLSETVAFILRKYPYVRHFVFNNLDPFMNRASENPEVVPRLFDFELELHRSMKMLEKSGCTFRVERVPLCFLSEFEDVSTETRKIVKSESRTVFFLDQKGKMTQDGWESEKGEQCSACSLNHICAGLFGWGRCYSTKELAPMFVDPEKIIKKIHDE